MESGAEVYIPISTPGHGGLDGHHPINDSFDGQRGAWRGNLRRLINESSNTKEFIRKLFGLATTNLKTDNARIILAIDTPLGFSDDFVRLVAENKYVELVESSATNPYLFRKTERYLFQHGLRPLSAIKDMIGSQATKPGSPELVPYAPRNKL